VGFPAEEVLVVVRDRVAGEVAAVGAHVRSAVPSRRCSRRCRPGSH